MATKVKDVVAPKHSDGSKDRKDWPPTPEDERMTENHTSDSITYNTPHATDHLDEIYEKAKRLKGLEPQRAKKLVADVLKQLKPRVKKLESL